MLEYQTKPAEAGRRLDVLIAELYPEFTRSSLKSLFDMSMVSVNGRVERPSYKVKGDDSLQIDESRLKGKLPEIKLPVIHEDEDVIVIDKPAGILTHSKGALNLEASVASFIIDKINDKDLTGNRAGIVHRLDRGTSGVIITAKNARALKWLQKQFSQRKVKKTYIAVVEGTPQPNEAIIEAPIGRNPRKPQTFKVTPAGRPASTHYKVISSFKKSGKNYSMLEITPRTGRTHQIRIHLAYVGHPIVGDGVYGHGGRPILLHAKELELTSPSGQREKFESALPDNFMEFISNDG